MTFTACNARFIIYFPKIIAIPIFKSLSVLVFLKAIKCDRLLRKFYSKMFITVLGEEAKPVLIRIIKRNRRTGYTTTQKDNYIRVCILRNRRLTGSTLSASINRTSKILK